MHDSLLIYAVSTPRIKACQSDVELLNGPTLSADSYSPRPSVTKGVRLGDIWGYALIALIDRNRDPFILHI